jgi:hypothetical protein
MYTKFGRIPKLGRVAALIGVSVLLGAIAVTAVAGETVTTEGKGKPVVYEGQLSCCQTLILKTSTQTIVKTPPLKPGLYKISYSVFNVMGHNVDVGCDANIEGALMLGGAAGNGSSTSGEGAGGIYGNASDVGTGKINTNGTQIAVECRAGTEGTGTYVASAHVLAEPIKMLVKTTQP